jgi:hypothetical protein
MLALAFEKKCFSGACTFWPILVFFIAAHVQRKRVGVGQKRVLRSGLE